MRQVTRVHVAQDGATPLFMASQDGRECCAKLLLEAKAAVDVVTKVGGPLDTPYCRLADHARGRSFRRAPAPEARELSPCPERPVMPQRPVSPALPTRVARSSDALATLRPRLPPRGRGWLGQLA